ncbi:MAG: nucleotidyltransferase family protein [Erysipelotrichaceae bacterium]|nr:nucleotidyltransferase family protein [Erysipelotrichaceae bacterium]
MNDQLYTIITILEKNKELMEMLNYISSLNLPNFYIAAGSIFQTIWNYYDRKELNFGVKDIDVIYFNNKDLSVERDLEYYNIINKYVKSKGFNYEIDVSNEARMHLWKMEHGQGEKVEPYKNSEDAMSKWIATVHAIGITKEDNQIKVYAPYGLSDIFSKTIRPIKHDGNSKELYDKKVVGWSERFNNLTIIEW